MRDGGLDLDVADLLVGGRGFSREIDERADAQQLEDRQVDVESDAEVQAQTLVPAAFRRERDAEVHRLPLAADRDVPPSPDDAAAGRRTAAEDALHELASTGADEAIEPDDLALPHPDGNVLEAGAA